MNTVPHTPSTRVPPAAPTPLVVLELGRDEMPLVESRRPTLRRKVEPVLRDCERLGVTAVLLNVAASSVDFAIVYCALAVSPL